VQRDGDRFAHHRHRRRAWAAPTRARGTGLAGLARRTESVDGTLEIASPPRRARPCSRWNLPCARVAGPGRWGSARWVWGLSGLVHRGRPSPSRVPALITSPGN